MFGLAQIQQAGFEVDDPVIERGALYLTNHLDEMDLRTRAYALYSMALNGQGDAAAVLALADESLNELDPFSQAALALAFHQLKQPERAQAILDGLSARAVRMGDQVYWPQPSEDGQYYRKTMASTLRTTAAILDAYLAIEPGSSLVPGMARYVLSRRRGSSGWGTTNETTFAILALTDYTVMLERSAGTVSYQVTLDGKPLNSGRLDPGRSAATLDLPMDQLPAGRHQLGLTTSAGATLFYNLTEQYDLAGEQFPPTGVIQITRGYYDPDTHERLAGLVVGQLVQVRLKVLLENDASYVLVEDHLPGGLEALNEHLNTSPIGTSSFDTYTQMFWEDFGYNYKQIHTDRVSFFITQMIAGSHTFEYLARAVLSGDYLALPAEASTMYDLTTWGRGETSKVSVRQP
jgi:uncharacterized protein YfaS (alpha-2-macroglobulin family)